MSRWLDGKKTYIIMGLAIVYEVLGYLLGKHPTLDIGRVLQEAGIITLRIGVKKL